MASAGEPEPGHEPEHEPEPRPEPEGRTESERAGGRKGSGGAALRRFAARLVPASLPRDPEVEREARGEVAVLACLLAVVALLALVTSAGPPLLDRLAGQGLVTRFAAAQNTQAVVRQSAVLYAPNYGEVVDPATSGLGADLGQAGAQLLRTAKPPLAGVLRHESTRVVLNPDDTATAAGSVQLGLLYADDAPARAAYVEGRPPGRPSFKSAIPIAVSQRTRDALHLRLGQRLRIQQPEYQYTTDVVLVGVFAAPTDSRAPLWREQPLLERPLRADKAWQAQALIDPAALDALQGRGAHEMTVTWQSAIRMSDQAATPLATGSGLRALRTAANTFVTDAADEFCPDGGLFDGGCTLGRHGSGLLATADDIPRIAEGYGRARAQARTLESFALTGLIGIGLVTVVVTARLALQRRAAAQTLQRARGASATDLAVVRLMQTAPAALLGLGLGLGAGRLLAPSGLSLGSPLPAVLVAAVAWLTLPVLTWAALRDRGQRGGSAPNAARRLTVEAGVLALTVAGVLALRARGAGDGGIDLQMAAVPALLGVATVVLLIRVYPLPLRLLARAARRGSGAVGLISLSRAAREAPGQALALLVLVTTLSTAVFGGLVSQTVTDGRRTAAIWTTGADATVIGAGKGGTPDAALTALPGVRRAIEMRGASTQVTSGRDGYRFDATRVVGVDAAALHRAAPDSATARAMLAAGIAGKPRPAPGADGTVVLPALVSADFGAAAVGDTYSSSLRAGKVAFRIVGLLPGGVRRDPALGPLLDSDAARAAGTAGPAAVAPGAASTRPLLMLDAGAMSVLVGHDTDFSAVLLYGPHLDAAALHVTAARLAGPTGELRVRAEELARAQHDGLLRGVQRVYTVSTAFAVLLALLALILELLLSARDRGRTASRLRTLGLPTRGLAALNVLELLPMALAAAAGGIALGLALPGVLGPALSLREFTGGPVAPALHTDYALTAALALGLAALVLAAVGAETWLGRRRGLGAVLRLGETA